MISIETHSIGGHSICLQVVHIRQIIYLYEGLTDKHLQLCQGQLIFSTRIENLQWLS